MFTGNSPGRSPVAPSLALVENNQCREEVDDHHHHHLPEPLQQPEQPEQPEHHQHQYSHRSANAAATEEAARRATSAESELLIRLRNKQCLCVLDQANGAVSMFVQNIVERTSNVRFLLTTTQRALADEHSVALQGLTPENAVRMFIRRCPREDLRTNEVPKTTDPAVRPGDFMGRLRCALVDYAVLTPGSVMRVCARMRDPNGLTLIDALKAEKEQEQLLERGSV